MNIDIHTFGLYGFDKSQFDSPTFIESLYEAKLDILEEKQGKELSEDIRSRFITSDKFGAFLRLRRASMLDPRYPNIYFKNKESAKNALEIAIKLDALSKEEFLLSGIPYIFITEIGSYNFKLFQ